MSPELQAQVDALVATGLYVRTHEEASRTGKLLAAFAVKGALGLARAAAHVALTLALTLAPTLALTLAPTLALTLTRALLQP